MPPQDARQPKLWYYHFRQNLMTELMTIEIVNNNEGGHNDLLFSIPALIETKKFDTYYFGIAIEQSETIDTVKKAVSHLLQYWIDKLFESRNGETIFLPIDFSDQYTGCLKVQNQAEKFILQYGISRCEGCSIDPLNPENYYKEIDDFEAQNKKQLEVDQPVFILTIENQIQNLVS
jgi:hypothetical protein